MAKRKKTDETPLLDLLQQQEAETPVASTPVRKKRSGGKKRKQLREGEKELKELLRKKGRGVNTSLLSALEDTGVRPTPRRSLDDLIAKLNREPIPPGILQMRAAERRAAESVAEGLERKRDLFNRAIEERAGSSKVASLLQRAGLSGPQVYGDPSVGPPENPRAYSRDVSGGGVSRAERVKSGMGRLVDAQRVQPVTISASKMPFAGPAAGTPLPGPPVAEGVSLAAGDVVPDEVGPLRAAGFGGIGNRETPVTRLMGSAGKAGPVARQFKKARPTAATKLGKGLLHASWIAPLVFYGAGYVKDAVKKNFNVGSKFFDGVTAVDEMLADQKKMQQLQDAERKRELKRDLLRQKNMEMMRSLAPALVASLEAGMELPEDGIMIGGRPRTDLLNSVADSLAGGGSLSMGM